MGNIPLGNQMATILENQLLVDGKGQLYVNLKVGLEDYEGTLFTRIYITAKSAGMARAALKKCGCTMDDNASDMDQLENNPKYLAGRKVQVVVEENGKYTNVSIPVGPERAGKDALAAAKKMLVSAKKSDHGEDDEIPF